MQVFLIYDTINIAWFDKKKMKHMLKSTAIFIIIGALGSNVVLTDMASASFLRPVAFEEKSEVAEIADFQHNVAVFRHFVSMLTAEVQTMIDEQGSPLNELLRNVIVPIRHKRSGEPGRGERREMTSLEAIDINLNTISQIVAGTLASEEHADALNLAGENTIKILQLAADTISAEDEEDRDLKLLADKILSLQVACRLFVSCAAVLKNGRHFQSENFDRDVINFVKDARYPLLDRGNVACAVCFTRHTVGGLVELCALEREMAEEQRAALEEAVRTTIIDTKSLDPEALKMAVFDLFGRLVEARNGNEITSVCRLLKYFREEEEALDFELVDKTAVASRILSVGDSVKDLDTARELAMLLVFFDKERALDVVKSGGPAPLLYFVFTSLETMLEIGVRDEALAERIKTVLKERFDASRWPAILMPSELEQHKTRPSHRRLCAELAPINDTYLRNKGVFEAFKLNYPEEGENTQREKLRQAFVRAYKSAQLTPRHLFLPTFAEPWIDEDTSLGIPFGYGQTISQPSLVQLMTALVDPRNSDRVLEIGTGSGYQTALLANLTKEVYTIEVYRPLSERAERVCSSLGLKNITFHKGDGSEGWPTEAPFDIIMVTAEAPDISRVLLGQLSTQGGRLLIPIRKAKKGYAELTLVIRRGDKYETAPIGPTQWVRLVGAAGYGFETPQSRQPFIDFSPPPAKKPLPRAIPESAIQAI